jgi:hypothetical protein
MRNMRRMITLALAIAGLVMVALPPTRAAAQDAGLRNGETSSQRRVRARPRIVVTPAHRLVRNCVDIYVVERRATGPTVVPDMRCWWAYR